MPLFDWIRSDLHNLNLDWIISKIQTVEESEQGAVDAAADANASKTAAAASATAANNSKNAAAGSATLAAVSAQQAQNLVDQLDTTIAQDVSDWLENNLTPTSPPVDDTLTIQGAAADAKKTGDEISDLKTEKTPFPVSPFSKYGISGQVLRTRGNGTTEWATVGQPTDAQTATAVNAWLDAHPEATTTVQDWSLEYDKLVKGTLGFVTPEMYGAKGDGVTDDTQAFIDALANGNTNLYCSKTYVISSAVAVHSNTNIIGGEFLVSVNAFTATNEANITFKNCKFKGSYTGGSATSGNVLLFTSCENVKVESCLFNNIGSYFCIRYEKSSYCYTINNKIETYAYAGVSHTNGTSNVYVFGNCVVNGLATNVSNNRYPIALSGGDTWTASMVQPSNLFCCNNHIKDTVGLWEGIDAHSGVNMVIANNIIEGTATGISVNNWTTVQSGVTPPSVNNVLIDNNIVIGNSNLSVLSVAQYGINVGNVSTNTAKNVSITNNIIKNFGVAQGTASQAGIGIRIAFTDNIIVKNNMIDNIGYIGVQIASEMINGDVSYNTIDNLMKNENYGVYVVITPKELIDVHDNKIGLNSSVHLPFRMYRGPVSANTGYVNWKGNKGKFSNVQYADIVSTLVDNYTGNPSTILYAGKKGDIVMNSSPSVNGDVGWICMVDGSTMNQTRGTWYSLGTITE